MRHHKDTSITSKLKIIDKMVLLRGATGDIIFGAFETKEAARALTLTAVCFLNLEM